jgi:hypothetical protein
MAELTTLDSAQRTTLGAYWRRRAEGEITSWVGFQHVLDDLRVEGSPGPIVALAERAVADEYQHALWCRDWAERFGHAATELRPRSERPITLSGASARENRLFRIALCCFSESVGVFTLTKARPAITHDELRRLNRRHLSDELRHSRVGWGHLATLNRDGHKSLQTLLPELLRVLAMVCCQGPESECEDLVAFGYFTPRLLREAHDEARREIILPGLAHLGVEVAA